jgi:hypothetical protein
VTEEERQRIRDETKTETGFEFRLAALEKAVVKIWYGFGAAALIVGTSLWEQIKMVIFK